MIGLFLIVGLLIFIITIVVIYKVSKWLFKKLKIGNDKNRKFIAIIPSVLFIGLLVGAIMLESPFGYDDSYHYFDEYTWKEKPSFRKNMIPIIIEDGMAIDKTKEEIIDTFGEDFHYINENTIFYYLESYPYLPFRNPKILTIKFEGGKSRILSQNKLYN